MVLVGGVTTVGFLLLSVGSATALAEERVRGSLDILLTTPLATRSILWGKWWGVYRSALVLGTFPALTALTSAYLTARWEGFGLVVGYVLAVGAALTSLGLALATWVSRLGRAIALSVTFYILITVGWLFLMAALDSGRSDIVVPGLVSASPFFGMIFPLIEMRESTAPNWLGCLGWIMFWTIVYASAALVLALATYATFDRCLGRRSEPFLPGGTRASSQRRPPDNDR